MLPRLSKAELWGGASASAVILPQAIAYGAALFVPVYGDPALGALLGLFTVVVFNLIGGIAGASHGVVYGPTGTTFAMLIGTITLLSAEHASQLQVLGAFSMVMILAGLTQYLIGLSGGGQLIKFLPYPVVYGFIMASALLMLLVQVRVVLPSVDLDILGLWQWLPLFTTFITILFMHLVNRFTLPLPTPLLGLIVGSVCFNLLAMYAPHVPQSWMLGKLAGLDSIEFHLSWSVLGSLNWNVIISSALALAVLASLDSLLTASLADGYSGERHKPKKELMAEGLGQMVSGMFGGMAGAGATGATMSSLENGGGRYAAIYTGIIILISIFFLRNIGTVIPVSALVGIIIYVAVRRLVNREWWLWLRYRQTRFDAITSILVIAAALIYDMMVAIGAGMMMAVFHFLRAQVQASIVNRRVTVAEHPSLRHMPDNTREFIQQNGERIVLYELCGDLFFGTADRLQNILRKDLRHGVWMILELGRVRHIDLTIMNSLEKFAEKLKLRGGELILANVEDLPSLIIEDDGRKHIRFDSGIRIDCYADEDEALEYAEDALLKESNKTLLFPYQGIELDRIELYRYLQEAEIAILFQYLDYDYGSKGEVIIESGDRGDSLYMVLRGEITALLPFGQNQYKRLAKFGPGSFFGEIAFLNPGPRSARILVTHDADFLILSRTNFNILHEQYPSISAGLLLALGESLGLHLRRTMSELESYVD